jgi:hypothetical protein
MKQKKDWKKNRVVKRILELQLNYGFRHMYAGCAIGFTGSSEPEEQLKEMWECDCCGTLTTNTESLYHRDPENMSGISICSSCSSLWRIVGGYVMKQEEMFNQKKEMTQ